VSGSRALLATSHRPKAGLLQKLGVAIEGSRELFLPSSGQKH